MYRMKKKDSIHKSLLIKNISLYFLEIVFLVHFFYFISIRDIQSIILLLLTFFFLWCVIKNISVVFAITLFFVDILYWINREGFSGSLHESELQDVITSEMGTPNPTVKTKDIVKKEMNNSDIDISGIKMNQIRKNSTYPTSANPYNSIYTSVLSSNNYITLPPTPTLSLPTLNRKNTPILSDTIFITSPGMNTSMTEMPKLTGFGLSAKKYDTVYQDAISENKYNTVFDKDS